MKKQGPGVRGQGSEKAQNELQISAYTVRLAVKRLGEAHLSGVDEYLQVQTYEGRKKVRQVLVDLVKAGQVEYHGEEIYRLTVKGGRGGVQAKLWEFACLRFATAKPFTAVEASRLAECDLDYTKRYCRWLWGAGYLAIVSRGRAGAMLYQVVGGQEHESAPAWNRRAEKRKNVGQAPSPAVLPAPSAEIPPSPPLAKGGEEDHRLEACATSPHERFDAVLAEFGKTMVEISGSCRRAQEIIQQMQDEIQAVKEQGYDEPVEPTEGHH